MFRRCMILGILLIPLTLASCNGGSYTEKDRDDLIDVTTDRVVAELKVKASEILPEIKEEAIKVFKEKASDLELSEEQAEKMAAAVGELLGEAVNAILDKKAAPAIKATLDKILPPPAEPGGGVFGKILATILGMAAQAGVAAMKKG